MHKAIVNLLKDSKDHIVAIWKNNFESLDRIGKRIHTVVLINSIEKHDNAVVIVDRVLNDFLIGIDRRVVRFDVVLLINFKEDEV